ncbi:uncharacterized protein [Ptychodera flava]|uniref:uncharacterized protein n=1 Tax=Ptychodera flava TaxID=63121 RepID=UPI00396A5613
MHSGTGNLAVRTYVICNRLGKIGANRIRQKLRRYRARHTGIMTIPTGNPGSDVYWETKCSFSVLPYRTCIGMWSKRRAVPYILGAVSMVLIYSLYYSVISTNQADIIREYGVTAPKHLQNTRMRFDVKEDTVTKSSTHLLFDEELEDDTVTESSAHLGFGELFEENTVAESSTRLGFGEDLEEDTITESSAHLGFDEVQHTEAESSNSVRANVDRALRERIADVRARIKDVESLLKEKKEEIHIDEEMVKLALKHRTSVERLIQKFKEVLLMNRTFAIGVVGGSVSVGAGVGGSQGIYATSLGNYMEKMLGSNVTVQNGAIGATNSYYYGYCFETHCNVREMDLLLWEFAHNDFGYPDGIFGHERLTRMILADLPNEPQLIYTNFLHGRQISKRSCVNNERNASVPLSEYYDVPSISMPDAICKQVKEQRADYLLSENDKDHPGPKGHDMVGVFLAEFVKEVLLETIEILEKELSASRGSVKQAILEGVRPDYKHWDDKKLHQKDLPPVFFETTAITHPLCWSAMETEYQKPEMTLTPQDKYGWRLYILKKLDGRTDFKQVWKTQQPEAFIEFEITIPAYRDLNSTLAITTVMCEQNKCGNATVFIDNEYVTTLSCLNRYLITVVHDVGFNLLPGRHLLKVVSLDMQGFNIVSVSTAYEIPDAELKESVSS